LPIAVWFPSKQHFLPHDKTPQNTALILADGIGKFICLKVMSEDQPSHAVINRVKSIAPSARVSGKFDDFISSSNGKRRKRARIYGHMIEAVAANKYWVIFDNNTTFECFSNSLSVESASASVPPDVPPPSSQDRSKNPFVQQRDEVA
jgi:hypothetical protein